MSQLPRKQTAVSTIGAVGQLREVYADNWTCSDCQQENYASRPKCLRCKKSRPEKILQEATAALTAAPCDWFEAVDPNSRQIYYYNTKTGETQWDRPAELGPAPYATGWLGRGSLTTSRLYTKLNSLYLSRPARPQKSKEETEFIRKNYITEGNQEYNIWYGKFLSSDYNGRKKQETEKAESRCVLEKDAGFTKADGSFFCDTYQQKLKEKTAENLLPATENSQSTSENSLSVLDSTTISQYDQLKSSSFFTKQNNHKTNFYFCLHFARGFCHYGSDCHYYHRIPSLEFDDHLQRVVLFDCFGRSKHKGHRDDMDGVGSFQSPCRTLFVAGFTLSLYRTAEKTAYENLEASLLRHFGEWGEVESVNIIPRLSIAFVRYRMTPSAEFAKEAMQGQALDHDEVLTIRWAHDDPNPKARSAAAQADRDALVAMLVANNVLPPSVMLPGADGGASGFLDPTTTGFNYPIEYMSQYQNMEEDEEQKLKRQKLEEEGLVAYPNNLDQYAAYFKSNEENNSDSTAVKNVQGDALARLGLLDSDDDEDEVENKEKKQEEESKKEENKDNEEEEEEEDDGPDWIKVLDETTGVHYYFNQITGESSWTKPEDFVEEQQ